MHSLDTSFMQLIINVQLKTKTSESQLDSDFLFRAPGLRNEQVHFCSTC